MEPEEKTAKRRGRPPKEQDSPQGDKPEKGPEPRTGRPAKADKAARGKSPSPALDKVSRGKEQELTPAQRGGKTRRERNQNVKDFLAGKRETPFADGKQPPKSTKGAPVKEAEAPAPEIQAAAHAGGAAPPGGAGKNRLFEAVRASSIPYLAGSPL